MNNKLYGKYTITKANGEPTESEIKRFWEWCGFWQLQVYKKHYHYEATFKTPNWLEPDNNSPDSSTKFLPPINLNNLFKYAVPKAKLHLGQRGLRRLLQEWIERIILEEDSALALFWAIYKIIEPSSRK